MEGMQGFSCFILPIYSSIEFRYRRHAKRAETQAIKAGSLSSAIMGGMYLLGLGTFGIGFW